MKKEEFRKQRATYSVLYSVTESGRQTEPQSEREKKTGNSVRDSLRKVWVWKYS